MASAHGGDFGSNSNRNNYYLSERMSGQYGGMGNSMRSFGFMGSGSQSGNSYMMSKYKYGMSSPMGNFMYSSGNTRDESQRNSYMNSQYQMGYNNRGGINMQDNYRMM